MTRARIAGGVALAAVIAAGGWQSVRFLHDGQAEAQSVPQAIAPIAPAPKRDDSDGGVVTIDTPQSGDAEQGATPMAQRIAVLGVLNKRNGDTRNVALHPGQAVRVGDAVIRLRACDTTASWEPEQLTGAFVQVEVRQADRHWYRVFSGWLYKERPNLNVVQNGVYDVWPKSCKMSRPETGPATESAAAVLGSGASSAKKSAAPSAPDVSGEDAAGADEAVVPAAALPAPAAAPSSNAAPSNDR